MTKANLLRTSATLVAMAVAATLLAVVATTESAKASFPGGEGAIAFTSSRDQDWEVYQIDRNGSKQTRLTDAAGPALDPAWSFDGTRIAFVYDQGCDLINGGSCRAEIYLTIPGGSNETNLTDAPRTYDADPAWFPSGRKIAFRSDRSGNDDIYVMTFDPDGRVIRLVRITASTSPDMQPVVSPNGRKLAFVSRRDGDFDVYVMRTAPESPTNRPVKLTKNVAEDYKPDFSPDGQRITFASNQEGPFDIFAMNSDGSAQTNLTEDVAVDSSPVFSPDGQKIAFASNQDGDFEIWRMRADGSKPTRLTRNPALDTSPDWQPLP